MAAFDVIAEPAASPGSALDEDSGESRLAVGLVRAELLVIGVLAVLQLILVFRLQVNWDEFRFLSLVYEYKRETLDRALQTAHVHLFGWLPYVGQNEVDQIVAARVVYWLLLLGSAALLYLIGRKILSRPAALFAVVGFLSYSDVIGHGTSFRADGLALFLLLAGLALLLCKHGGYLITAASGALVAAALIVTIKAVFFLPTLALALLAVDLQTSFRERGLRLVTFASAVAVVFGILYAVHATSLSGVTPVRSAGYARSAGEKMLRLGDLVPRFDYLILTFLSNAFIWVLLGIGTALAVTRAIRSKGDSRIVLTLALLLPITSIAVYRNAFPYFYVLVMPTALIAFALPMDELLRKKPASLTRTCSTLAMVLAVLVGAGLNYWWFLQDDLAYQRRLVGYVHELFPTPVPYVDGHDMISSFPKAGFFMSTWGFEKYRERGTPVFRDLLVESQPVFVLATAAALRLDRARSAVGSPYQLLPEDRRVLEENFVQEWGPLFVAGKRVRPGRKGGGTVDILIGGPYRLEAAEPVTVGDTIYSPGTIVELSRGVVELAAASDSALVILRWAHPAVPPPEERIRPPLRSFYPCAHPLASCHH